LPIKGIERCFVKRWAVNERYEITILLITYLNENRGGYGMINNNEKYNYNEKYYIDRINYSKMVEYL